MAESSQSQQRSNAPDGGGVAESSQSQQRSDAPDGGGVTESSQSQQKGDALDGGGGWLKVHNLNKRVMPLMEWGG